MTLQPGPSKPGLRPAQATRGRISPVHAGPVVVMFGVMTETLLIAAVFLGWLVLQYWLLPRLGVAT